MTTIDERREMSQGISTVAQNTHIETQYKAPLTYPLSPLDIQVVAQKIRDLK